jgi:NAD(P)-dependent dehydrogenase (short-subunit alcohol dehydrogenase family)
MAHDQMRRFDGRVAVVTGAASGIGAATAGEFAAEGALVALLDIDDVAGDAARRAMSDGEAGALFIHTDVSDPSACARAVAEVMARYGRIDCLINSAVNFIARGLDVTAADWDAALRVNVQGGANMVQVCAPALAQTDHAAVVNVASISGYIAQPGRWTYNACKGAILSLTRCQALDLSAQGIRVNSVSPGWTWTPEVDRAAGGERARWEPVWGKFHMLRRCAEPREVARAILFLCSEDASFITAADLHVDGGYLGLGSEGLGEASHFAASVGHAADTGG